jgi:hypothetical protein
MNPYCGHKRDWYNDKGYHDPTVAQALTNIGREQSWKPCVFICSPFAGDVNFNTQKAIEYTKFAVEQGAIPFAPHLLYPQVLDDSSPKERELGIFFGMVWLGKCEEIWVFGDTVSAGMEREITRAEKRGLTIRYFNEKCEEVAR